MAISIAVISSAEASSTSTSYSTPSLTIPANALCVLYVGTNRTIPVGTVTGHSLTWTRQAESEATSGGWRITMFTAQNGASGSSNTISIPTTQTATGGRQWVALSVTGHHKLAPFRQVVIGSSPSASSALISPLNAGAHTGNRPLAGFVCLQWITPRANWTELADVQGAAYGTETQWRSDAFETSASGTWATMTTAWAGIAAEIEVDIPVNVHEPVTDEPVGTGTASTTPWTSFDRGVSPTPYGGSVESAPIEPTVKVWNGSAWVAASGG